MYTSWEKGDHYYIQTRHNDLFSHYNLFLGKLKKLARKARVNTDASVSDRPRAPWASHNTPYYSFKIFPKFWLAKSTRIIHHNQLLMTKVGRILCLTRKWRQKSGAIGSCKNAACYRLRHRYREDLGTRLSCFGCEKKWRTLHSLELGEIIAKNMAKTARRQ